MGNIGSFPRFHDRNHVETNALKHPAAIRKIDLGRFSYPSLFERGHGFDRRSPNQGAARLYFDKDKRTAIEGDEVDLAAPTPEIVLENVIPARAKVIGGSALALVAYLRGRTPTRRGHYKAALSSRKSKVGTSTGA